MRPAALFLAILTLAAALFGAACRRSKPSSEPGELLVFAAASTADVMNDLAREFHDATGETIRFSFGASRDLARQVRAGAPADVFVSADAETIDALVADQLVAAADRRPLASNRLVVIVPGDSSFVVATPGDLTKAQHLALGDPDVVPVGAYAKKWLERVRLWEQLRPGVVLTLDARASLAAVESGHAEVGVVYATDAASSRRVRVVYRVPPEETPHIAYLAARLSRSKNPAAEKFANFAASPNGKNAFARHGFLVEGVSP
jgi:molybdate transport system substrate-binding protein